MLAFMITRRSERMMELEADAISLYLLQGANIPLEAALEVQESFSLAPFKNPNVLMQCFSNHPDPTLRIHRLQSEMDKIRYTLL